jgi:hypothetical protein
VAKYLRESISFTLTELTWTTAAVHLTFQVRVRSVPKVSPRKRQYLWGQFDVYVVVFVFVERREAVGETVVARIRRAQNRSPRRPPQHYQGSQEVYQTEGRSQVSATLRNYTPAGYSSYQRRAATQKCAFGESFADCKGGSLLQSTERYLGVQRICTSFRSSQSGAAGKLD